jgi:hypothetical protein
MTTLTGKKPKDTYKDLLQVSNSNSGVDATLRSVSDGEGTASAISLSTTNVDIIGDLTAGTLNADGDTAAGDNAAIGYTAAEGLILTGQGSTDDITVKNDADTTVLNVATGGTDVEISAGNILFGTASKGVYLGVTTATAANLLDDYEEGTFTPTLTATTTNPTVSSGSLTGYYRKIGGTVFLYIKASVVLSNVGSGTIRIASLPFTSADTIDSYAGALAGRGLSVSGTTTIVVPFVQKQEAYMVFNLFDQAAYPGGETQLTHSNLGTSANGCNWYITVNYAV